MNHYRRHHVYVKKTRGERDSYCVEFSPHITPLLYNSSSENSIIASRELAYSLKKPVPQTKFSNIGDSQIVAIEKLAKIFTKETDNVNITADPPKNQEEQKSAIIPQKMQPGWTKYITSVQPNVIEDEEEKVPTNYQHMFTCTYQGQLLFPMKSLSHHQW